MGFHAEVPFIAFLGLMHIRDAGFEVLKLAYQQIANNEPTHQEVLTALASEFQLSYQASVRKYNSLLKQSSL
ncbi:hypothetical protein GCM10011338_10320 [Alteromonas lipolytica]|nr:hypothetical protein GCM10011338_10320 [Alteromonas lipolytica]